MEPRHIRLIHFFPCLPINEFTDDIDTNDGHVVLDTDKKEP